MVIDHQCIANIRLWLLHPFPFPVYVIYHCTNVAFVRAFECTSGKFSGGRLTSTLWWPFLAMEQAGSNGDGVRESACLHTANILNESMGSSVDAQRFFCTDWLIQMHWSLTCEWPFSSTIPCEHVQWQNVHISTERPSPDRSNNVHAAQRSTTSEASTLLVFIIIVNVHVQCIMLLTYVIHAGHRLN